MMCTDSSLFLKEPIFEIVNNDAVILKSINFGTCVSLATTKQAWLRPILRTFMGCLRFVLIVVTIEGVCMKCRKSAIVA